MELEMRCLRIWVVLSSVLFCGTRSHAGIGWVFQTSTKYQHQDLSFDIDFSVKGEPFTFGRKIPDELNIGDEENPYAAMGVLIKHRESLQDFGHGIPVRFAGGGIGLLTNAILIGVESRSIIEGSFKSKSFIQNIPGTSRVFRVLFASPEEALMSLHDLKFREDIRFAHPDFRLPLERRSISPADRDPMVPLQWHFNKLGVEEAWQERGEEGKSLVGLIDLGFEVSHPDLKGAWYVNPSEIPGNKRDDDHNGLIDDVSGWNFGVGSANLLYGAGPGHGTATAGIIGARANGSGVTGICPDCQVLPLVIDDLVSSAVAAFHYARIMGVTVVSNSWGYRVGTPETLALVEAINQLAVEGRHGLGVSIVFAMSNKDEDNCRGREPDISSLTRVVSVSAVDAGDVKIVESGFGSCLTILAPTSEDRRGGIVTTDRQGNKGFNVGGQDGDLDDLDFTNSFHGTSAAAPQVAAGLALLYAACPSLTRDEALLYLTSTADKVNAGDAAYDPKTGHSTRYGYGRLHIGKMLKKVKKDLPGDRCAVPKNEKYGP
jgi:hypothetical protein